MARAFSSQTTSEKATVSTSSPDYGSERDFDVFLNFRGPDTRSTVVAVLDEALKRAGIRVFYDDKDIRKGEGIEGELLSAITNSKIYIPIFSKDYASSRWCLRELAKMMECRRNSGGDERQKVILPIFCDVNVSKDLKLRSQVYTSALEKHKIEQDETVAKSWEDALKDVAKIKGWNLRDHGLPELTKLVVEAVCGKIRIGNAAMVPDHIVGIHEPMEDIMKLLDQGTLDVRFLVIYGMGGTGKTTLARLIFKKISSQFQDGHIFLLDVSELSRPGIVYAQQKLLSKICDLSFEIIDYDDVGVDMIKQTLQDKKVLIVLDNLDSYQQLVKLAGEPSWFGQGSRIIITTRSTEYLADNVERPCNNSDLVARKREGFYFYGMQELDHDNALKLFSKLVFQSDSPPLDYDDISREIVAKTGRLPLAIEVIAPLFRCKGKDAWKDELEKLKTVVHKDVRKSLEISYQGLDDYEKQIFLGVACLFINERKTNATYYWEAQNLFPKSGINVLINRSLIKIVGDDVLWMHDLLRDLGRNIVCEESSRIPKNRSRLWLPKEALDVIQKKKAATELKVLHLIECNWLTKTPNFFTFFKLERLILDGCDKLKEIHKSIGKLKSLMELRISCSSFIRELSPSIEELENLEYLTLTWFIFFIGKLTSLVELDISYSKMEKLPDSIGDLKRLEILKIYACHTSYIPDSIGGLKSLREWRMMKTKISTLPGTIGNLKRLKVLNLQKSSIRKLPKAFENLENLEELNLAGCHDMDDELPETIGNLKRLKVLNLQGCSIRKLPKALGNLENLEELDLRGCSHMGDELPETTGNLKRLKVLNLGKSSIRKLPKALGNLKNLEELDLWGYHDMDDELLEFSGCLDMDEELPETIGNLKRLKVLNLGNIGIRKLPKTLGNLENLKELDLRGCHDMDDELPETIGNLKRLEVLNLRNSSIRKLPKALGNLENLEELDLYCCYHMDDELPKEIGKLSCLRILRLKNTKVNRVPTTINQLSHLQMLFLGEFWEPYKLPTLPTSLTVLEVISPSLESPRIPDLSNMTNLVTLILLREGGIANRSLEISQPLVQTPKVEWLQRLVKLKELKLDLPDLILVPSDLSSLCHLEEMYVSFFNPQCLTHLPSGLKDLDLYDAKSTNKWQFFLDFNISYQLCHKGCLCREIQVDGPKQLSDLVLKDCVSLEKLSTLSCLKNLDTLVIINCPCLVDIQGLGEIECLRSLSMAHCGSIERLPDLSSLKKLVLLGFTFCDSLQSIPVVDLGTQCGLWATSCKHFDDYKGPYKKLEPRGELRRSEERRGDGGKSRNVAGSGGAEIHELNDEEEEEEEDEEEAEEEGSDELRIGEEDEDDDEEEEDEHEDYEDEDEEDEDELHIGVDENEEDENNEEKEEEERHSRKAGRPCKRRKTEEEKEAVEELVEGICKLSLGGIH